MRWIQLGDNVNDAYGSTRTPVRDEIAIAEAFRLDGLVAAQLAKDLSSNTLRDSVSSGSVSTRESLTINTASELQIGTYVYNVPLVNRTNYLGDFMDTISRGLAANTSLQKLRLIKDAVGSKGFLSRALKTNKTILQLDLTNNKEFGVVHAEDLAEVLAANTSLKKVVCDNVSIKSVGFGALVGALRTNFTLEELSVRENDLGGISLPSDGQEVARSVSLRYSLALALVEEGLAASISLKRLHLDRCGINASMVSAIAQGLEANNSLVELTMSYNYRIGDDGAALLAKGIASNTSLQKLDLNFCGIAKLGATSLAEALRTNTVLEGLDLGKNFAIGFDGADAFGRVLASHTSLKSLNLVDCGHNSSLLGRPNSFYTKNRTTEISDGYFTVSVKKVHLAWHQEQTSQESLQRQVRMQLMKDKLLVCGMGMLPRLGGGGGAGPQVQGSPFRRMDKNMFRMVGKNLLASLVDVEEKGSVETLFSVEEEGIQGE